MRAGDRLPSERELARRFDISRQTVREVLVALEIAGLVEIRVGSGVYVDTGSGSEDVPGPLEILEARGIFESEAAALAAERIGNEELHRLKGQLRLMTRADERGDIRKTEEHDRRFHLAIAEASRNNAIVTTVDHLWRLCGKFEIGQVFHERARERDHKPNIDDHDRILEALLRRDPEAARDVMKTHIVRVQDEYSQFTLG